MNKVILLILSSYCLVLTLYSGWLRRRLNITQRILDEERTLRRRGIVDDPPRRKR